jgi:hypothetical protein
MVHAEPHENKNKEEEVKVWVVTEGGAKKGMDFEHGEGLG